ncbi:hypothetical protein PPYR_09405 [Photinus pyralis]|uniref:Uncharacterized protein n=2 Tax=Photinus pyralis TaxID=7054 RepID=A0A5N4AM36_PHOPY|nr:uncharacterized protein LOC116172495 [Photinus pyralis]KAB0798412.1 hypothetical protein PPYR_09405 [Photinus pyralis]
MKKLLLVFFIASMTSSHVECVMSEAQLKSAAKLLRNVCQPKTKISAAQLATLQTGVVNQDEPEVMSYIECILRTGQIMKDAKLNIDSLKSQMANLPPTISEPGMITVEHCKDSPKSSDKFIAAAEFYKCFYDDNPANFFFP